MNDIKEFYNSVALSSLFHKENKRKKILSPCYNYQIIKKKILKKYLIKNYATLFRVRSD